MLPHLLGKRPHSCHHGVEARRQPCTLGHVHAIQEGPAAHRDRVQYQCTRFASGKIIIGWREQASDRKCLPPVVLSTTVVGLHSLKQDSTLLWDASYSSLFDTCNYNTINTVLLYSTALYCCTVVLYCRSLINPNPSVFWACFCSSRELQHIGITCTALLLLCVLVAPW